MAGPPVQERSQKGINKPNQGEQPIPVSRRAAGEARTCSLIVRSPLVRRTRGHTCALKQEDPAVKQKKKEKTTRGGNGSRCIEPCGRRDAHPVSIAGGRVFASALLLSITHLFACIDSRSAGGTTIITSATTPTIATTISSTTAGASASDAAAVAAAAAML